MAVTSAEQRHQMLNEPVGPLLFRKAVPMVLTQMITVIYNTADTYFVAKINTEASAAVGVAFSLMAIIQAVGFGMGMGTGSLISRQLGAAKDEQARTTANSGLLLGALFGTVLLILGLLFLRPLMSLLGASENVLPYAADYSTYILIAAPFMCASFVLNNILRSEGQTTLSMVGMMTGGLMNLALDPLMIFGLDMGIKGAAAATMIGQMTGLAVLCSFFFTKKSIIKIAPGAISRKIRVYTDIIRTGSPTILRQGLASLATAILNNQAAHFSDAAVAAVSISNKLYMLSRNIVLGIGQGFQPVAGYCYGAGRYDRVKKSFWLSTAAGTVIVVIIAIAMYLFRTDIMTWFRADDEVIGIGSQCLLYSCISIPMMAYSTFVNQTYQCLGFAGGASLLASCRQGIFYVPLAFALPALIGITGIEMLQPAADILTFLVSIPFQIHFFRRHLDSSYQ
ncbi:MAG: MATE family efflux transporter [Parasporobacterium sp.]|nr:MATE family efflux transporter [Parasporobacterium sp.]